MTVGAPPSAPSVFAPPPPLPSPPTFDAAAAPSFTPAAAPSFTPSSVSEPPPPAAPPSIDQAELAKRKAAAEAIAAKFANIKGGLGISPSVAAEPQPANESTEQHGSAAERMMRKMGYQAGQGLGVDGSGIKHALSAEHTKPIVSKKGSSWTQSKTAQGKLVDLNENERAKADMERYGEPSRIICLRNVVGSPAEVDDDLPGEMADECNNYGVVERVLIHHVMPPPNPVDAIRIFIVFTGLAGAWRCAKELDGRFFAGREVRATYFDEKRFQSGDKNGPVL